MNFFVYDNAENKLSIDEYSVLLVKEFKDLWDITRNKCKEDKTGKLRLRAYKELTYIYLVLDYKSPYFLILKIVKIYKQFFNLLSENGIKNIITDKYTATVIKKDWKVIPLTDSPNIQCIIL